jgi:predicted nucleic acid-binding protein
MSGYVFLDTSALAKRYHHERRTDVVDQWLLSPGKRHVISHLAFLEVQSVFARKVREGVIPRATFLLFRRLLGHDLGNNLFEVEPLESRHLWTAERLIEKHGLTNHIRTLDALQLASAVELREHGRADYFLCADSALCSLAAHEGFTVVNPETGL